MFIKLHGKIKNKPWSLIATEKTPYLNINSQMKQAISNPVLSGIALATTNFVK